MILNNVQQMRKGVEPKKLKEKATKKSISLAPNFRKSDDQRQKEKIEKEKQQFKQMTKKSNRNTSQSADRNNSLPRIKNSMSNDNISPPKVKKSKSSQGIMSPNKKRSSNKNNGSMRKSRAKTPSPMFSIGSPGDEPASPGEYNAINPSNGREQISLDFQPIPSDQTPIIQIENASSKQKSKRIPTSLSIPGITKSGPKRKIGKMGNGNDPDNGNALSPTRALSMIDGDPHHALSPSYNISEDAVPFTYSRPGN